MLPRMMVEQCGSYEFAMEPLTDALIAELRPLDHGFWSETEVTRRDEAPIIDYEHRKAMSRLGRFVVFTVRQRGVLVGMFTVHIEEAARTAALVARDDALYVLPEHRGGRLALRIVQYAIERLAGIGVTDLVFNVQIGTRSERLAEHIGMRPISTLYHKRVSA